ncbi:retrovirus-like pol polyprotein [Lasius niger]|uniref:Retrovirus-like pol polyprotein n=1 Tax=Lasius niger TaxID=67767 RepID=A0A0J7KRK6_LASNI|nr:retrovirus-like pol polyprotein [Lasius niger]
MRDLQLLHNWVSENLEQAYQKQSSYYNLRRRDIAFHVGDLVLKRQHVLSSAAQNIAAKLAPKFHGPFCIAALGPNTEHGQRLPAFQEPERGVQTERTWSVDQVLNEVFGRDPTETTESGI